MERHQNSSEAQRCKDIQQEDDIYHQIAHFLRQLEPGQCYDDLYERHKGEQKKRGDKCKEIPVISFADACADPWAMMIEPFHADIAIIAMRGPWRPIYVASITKLQPQAMGLYWYGIHLLQVPHNAALILPIEWYIPQLLILIARQDFRDHARVCDPQYYQHDLNHNIKKHSNDDHCYRCFECSNGVVDDCTQPEENVSSYVFFGLGHQEAETFCVGLVVCYVGHLVHVDVIGCGLLLTH